MPDSAVALLSLPARQVACRLALPLLEEWDRTRARLDDPADAEALHDFRVALRRIRSVFRSLRPGCDDLVPPTLRRRLRQLADTTSQSRDLEVQRAWLLAHLPKLTPRQRREAKWLASRLERQAGEENAQLRRRVEKRYSRLHERLWATLASEDQTGAGEAGSCTLSAAAVVGEALAELTGQLEYRFGTIHSITDEAEAHAARIIGKRIRYLLEPLQEELSGAPAAMERLKQLQDLLGTLHDLHRTANQLGAAFRDAAIAHADHAYRELLPWGEVESDAAPSKVPSATGGLAALARMLRTEGEVQFGQLKSEWLDGAMATELCAELHRLAAIVSGLRPPGIEIERKYLLSALPTLALSAPSEEIEQGWLPGKQLVERLRHVRSADADAWFRTVKSGQGIQRVEIEEATTRELFEALWPLTEGCRVFKRRYLVRDGTATWQIDQFLDRELVLAEIELPAVETPVEIPEWLAEVLVREVTDEPWYVNRVLAR